MGSTIYWSYSQSHFRTALKTALQNCRYFSMKRVCFLWKHTCWKTLQLETHQFIRGTKFSSPAPAGPCGTQSFGTLCPHPPLCGTMEKHLANGTYTLHAHTSSLLHLFYIVYTSLLIDLKYYLKNRAATELWPNKGCVFFFWLRRTTNTEVWNCCHHKEADLSLTLCQGSIPSRNLNEEYIVNKKLT